MAGPTPLNAPNFSSVQITDAVYQAFQDYSWDLDKDFLGGLVLALGGHRSLSQTASKADIIMHSRIFYYARLRGVTIPYGPYRAWLRAQLPSRSPSPPLRLWEWDLLQAMCNHRDRVAGAGPPDAASQAAAAAEKDAWIRRLLDDSGSSSSSPPPPPPPPHDDADGGGAKPAWMAAAPRAELYVDRDANGGDDAGEQVPYPERFAAIIKAVQTGEPVEGIVEIPDIVARNPTTTPFGKLERPRKPWERDGSAVEGTAVVERPGGEVHSLDASFPDPDNDTDRAS
ncbi:unnamed protein product [Discula destructiva]